LAAGREKAALRRNTLTPKKKECMKNLEKFEIKSFPEIAMRKTDTETMNYFYKISRGETDF
jgi:hypothetical protein